MTIATLLSGCAGLPSSGPSTSDVIDQSGNDAQNNQYVLADVNAKVVDILQSQPFGSLYSTFGGEASQAIGTIRIADHVSFGIWESGTAKLFSPSLTTQAQVAPIPDQVVANDGTIMVPYAGRLKISGLTPAEAQLVIQDKLKDTAAQPQVMLALTQSLSDIVTVSGDDIHGAIVPLTSREIRLLDAIAYAGGLESTVFSATVQVVRDGISMTVPMQRVMEVPKENIRLHPHDTIVISKNPEYFTVLGAAGKIDQVPFQAPQVSLAEALGRAGGLVDERADAAGIFVFRYEPADVAMQLCSKCSFADGIKQVPVAFHLNLRQTPGLFSAQSFQMSNHDVLYVADAPAVELARVLGIVRDMMTPILTGAAVDRAVLGK